ncbi:hypothetical protein [Paenibacillus ottowii]|uniref:hypothetical protein n=1 Tax=Paenibacillus ottowii TaxID=2315729 RepID=UPI00139009DD|nr:hypothetical protein [Paenibacillus ottowii]
MAQNEYEIAKDILVAAIQSGAFIKPQVQGNVANTNNLVAENLGEAYKIIFKAVLKANS